MAERRVTTYYLEMRSPDALHFKESPDPTLRIEECLTKQWRYNRFLYQLVGRDWHWTDKQCWSDQQWRDYAESDALRTWAAYVCGSPAGYFELQRQAAGDIEIAYFGLVPSFTGRGLGGALLSHAIRSAWEWGAARVWAHTCTLDHPHALGNYRARGMTLYKEETTARVIAEPAPESG